MKRPKNLVEVARPILNRLRYVPKMTGRKSLQTVATSDSLFGYTSGRWLWDEREQLRSRYRRFNVSGLQQVACQSMGAHRCISLSKIGEGNYNKAYRLTMEDGRRVIAKIPHPNAGPPLLTTASEVATMEFVRTALHVPVPKVLAWSASSQNPVGAEYIIMEEAKGSQLHEAWEALQLRAKCEVVSKIVDIEKKLLSVSFEKIGSLYFCDSDIPGCVPIEGMRGVHGISDNILSRFCIGPIVRREFWEKERSTMHQYHGPWDSSMEYLEAVTDREMDWITTYAEPQKVTIHPWQYTSPEQSSPEAHLASLRKLRSLIPLIVPQDAEIVSSRMWHPDFHAGNIFLDTSGQISSIIDWQGTWTTPLFIGVNPPSLLDYGVDMLMKLPDNFKDLDNVTKDRLRYRVSQSVLIHKYESLTAEKNPAMYKMMRHPHGQTLKQLEAFAGSTWNNCLFPLQECLIRVYREWEHFGSHGPCPYRFEEDEIQRHYEEGKIFNESQSFWDEMRGVLSDEGYTQNDTFGKAVEALRDLRSAGLSRLQGEEKNAFDRNTYWVLDIPVRS